MIRLNLLRLSVSLCLMLLASAWNIPFLYLLAKWINTYLLLIVNLMVCLLVAPLLAQTPVWVVFPYTYHYKVTQYLLNLKPSGDILVNQGAVHLSLIIFPVLLSLVVTVLIIFFLKQGVKNVKK